MWSGMLERIHARRVTAEMSICAAIWAVERPTSVPWEIASLRAVACSSGRRLCAIVTSSFAQSALVWTGCWTQVAPGLGGPGGR